MSTNQEWVPFGLTDKEASDYAVLLPDLPGTLGESLIHWLRPALFDGQYANISYCLQLQVVTGISLSVPSTTVYHRDYVVDRLRALEPIELLRVVDYVVANNAEYDRLRRLEEILRGARSQWTVGKRYERSGLVERVPAGVQAAVEGAIKNSQAAGRVLARAWSHVHGLTPNDSAAYADAVRAAEISGILVVEPQNATATLGTVLGKMRADGDWRLPLREHALAPGPETVLALIRTLWHGHRDRHGSADYTDVTHNEARAAVMLAACIVDWFASGALARQAASPSGH